MCTWSSRASANIVETNTRGDEQCHKLLDGHIQDKVSKVLYLGGSHIFRVFKAHSQKYNCECRLTVKASRCNLMKTLGLQRRHRNELSSCEDNGDIPSTICVDAKSGAECIEQNFISLEFAKDAEMQTKSTKTLNCLWFRHQLTTLWNKSIHIDSANHCVEQIMPVSMPASNK
jgi:hypothetical protein